MQAMKCEICGANDIVKQEGIFVCQHCGTKYTVEEAKKLIGVVTIDKTDENEKFLTLARRALNNSDINNGLKYWELVAENDPMNWEAIFYLPYFRIEKNPSDGELVVPYAHAIKEAFDIIHEKEPQEKQIEYAKEICSRVSSSGCTMQLKVIEVWGQFMQRTIAYGRQGWPEQTPSIHIFLEAAAEKVREYYSDVPEIIKLAEDLEKKAKEYAEYPLRKIDEAGEKELKRMDDEAKQFKRQQGGCYVATCVYGSYDCPEVWTLRRFRDNTLSATWYGRTFISVYYAISPKLVKMFGKTKWFKAICRSKLDRFVFKLQNDGVASTPYIDKK